MQSLLISNDQALTYSKPRSFNTFSNYANIHYIRPNPQAPWKASNFFYSLLLPGAWLDLHLWNGLLLVHYSPTYGEQQFHPYRLSFFAGLSPWHPRHVRQH